VRYAAPARLVGRQAVPVSAGFPASPFPPGCFSASPLRLGRFPSFAVPAWPVSQPRRSNSAGFPASPFPVRLVSRLAGPGRPVARPPRRHAPPRQCQTPAKNTGFPAFPASRGSPRMVPVPCGECISTPSASVTQELTGIHLDFFPRPHVVHRIPPVIRTFHRLSTGFCTAHPQVTRRNSSPWRQADLRPNRMEAASTPSGPLRALPSPVPSGSMAHRSGSSRTDGTSTQPGPEPLGAERARKYDCPFWVAGLPWIYDHAPGAEATRVHEPGVAASGCPDRGSGCRVSANRHLPAAAPRKFPRAVFVYPGPN
jgi:hypothetical protein